MIRKVRKLLTRQQSYLQDWLGLLTASEINKNLLIIVVYLLILIFFFYKTFTNAYIFGDFIAYWLPNHYFIFKSLQEGIVPFWQPYNYLGVPQLFKIDLVLFYPLTWIVYIFNLLFNSSANLTIFGKSIELMQYSYFFIASVGMFFLLLKHMRLNRIAAFSGGLVYGYSIFMVGLVADMASLPGKAYLPLLTFFLLSFLKHNSFRYYVILVVLNYLVLTFGYPYNYVYLFLAQLSLSLFFGVKKFLIVGASMLHSILLGAYILLPYYHVLSESYRGAISTIFDSSFHLNYAFTPTKIINIINPQVFGTTFDIRDPNLLFIMGRLSWGIFPLIFLVIALANFKKSLLNIWLLSIFVFGFIISFGGYLGVPELAGNIFPFLEKFRSHWQVLILTFFAGCVFLSQGIDQVLQGKKNVKTIFIFWQLTVLLLTYLLILPLWCHSCTNEANDVVVSIARTTVLLGISLLLYHLITLTKLKIFVIFGLIITVFEFNFYFQNLNQLRMPTTYAKYYAQNSLIPELPSENNLFRYSFESNQFAYNASFMSVFSIGGYESMPYQATYELGRLGTDKKLAFLNTKYVVTTNPEKFRTNDKYTLITTIDPKEKTNETFISSVEDLPYWTEESKNKHFIFELQSFLPRFFVPEQVNSCESEDCYLDENPPKLIYTDSDNITFKNPPKKQVEIQIISYKPNDIKLHINTTRKTFIASSEIWDKGWHLKINGQESNMHNISKGFRGFIVPEGESDVLMYYIPPYLYFGMLLTAISIVLFFIIKKIKY